MNGKDFKREVAAYENRKRGKHDDSDCTIIQRIWRMYWVQQNSELGTEIAAWLLGRLHDKQSNRLVKSTVYLHFYRNRHSIPVKHKKWFRRAIKELPRKKRKKLMVESL